MSDRCSEAAIASSRLTRRAALALALSGAAAACAPFRRDRALFAHGVASGDPGPTSALIWTRVTPREDAAPGPLIVRWSIARDAKMRRIVRTGEALADPARDYCVKVEVDRLKPDRRYWYRFRIGGERSAIGATRTLGEGDLDRLTLAFVRGGSGPGFAALAADEEIDAIIHLGDYLRVEGVRDLAGYRAFYAAARRDTALKAAHGRAPWICSWNEGEFARGASAEGAPGFSSGQWKLQKAAALKAAYEWLPLRDPAPGQPLEAALRAFQFGDLARIVAPETRVFARSASLSYGADMPLVSTLWDMTDPDNPVPALPGAPLPANIQTLPTPFRGGAFGLTPVLDWAEASAMDPARPPEGVVFLPDLDAFRRLRLEAPGRAILGLAQETELVEHLLGPEAGRVRWRILASAARLSAFPAPDGGLEGSSAPAGLPLDPAQWDGYPAERAQLLSAFAAAGGGILAIAGAPGPAFAAALPGPGEAGDVGVELGLPALDGAAPAWSGTPDLAQRLAGRGGALAWSADAPAGYLRLTLRNGEALAEHMAVEGARGPRLRIRPGGAKRPMRIEPLR